MRQFRFHEEYVPMHKPYDTTLKQMLNVFGADWLAWLARRYGYPASEGTQLNPEIDTIQLAADQVIRFPGDLGILHLEVQSSWDGELAERMLEYNVFLHRRENVAVHSVAILLRREANVPGLTGTLTRRRHDGQRILEFDYDIIRVWELSADELLNSHLGIAPLGLLTDDAEPRLPELVHQFAKRVETELPTVAIQSQLLASSSILLGLRYNTLQINSLFTGVQPMRESSMVQAWLAEGEAKGQAKGIQISLIALLEQKFGSIPPDVEARIQASNDATKLQAAIRQVLSIQSPNELVL